MKFPVRIFPILLLTYHLAFAWVAYQYILANHGDAEGYWFLRQDLSQASWLDFLQPGTDVIKLLTFPLVKFLGFPFWSGFLIFSLLSSTGIMLLYRMLLKHATGSRELQMVIMLLFLLPTLHFWTAIPGKESLLFLMTVIFLKYSTNTKPFSWQGISALVGIALIRPHMAIIMLICWAIAVGFCYPMNKKRKSVFFICLTVALGGILVLLKSILRKFTGFQETVLLYYDVYIRHMRKTNAYVPLDEYGLPYKMFTFYFRPLPFEKEGWMYGVISLENTVLLGLSCAALGLTLFNLRKIHFKLRETFSALYLLAFAGMYVYAYANYGIISRTKILVYPFIFILILQAFKLRTALPPSSTDHE